MIRSRKSRTSVLSCPMTRDEVERGLTDGTLERGVTSRYAKGTRTLPAQGALLMPFEVNDVQRPGPRT